MLRKALVPVLAFALLLGVLLGSPLSSQRSRQGRSNAIQQGYLSVHNCNTSKSYSTIQEAINAPETLDGHEISVDSGIYHEHVNVNKSLSLTGEDRSTTIIDGDGTGKVVYVTADNVEVRGFTIQDGTFGLWLHNSQNSKIVGNTLQDGSYGIRLYYAPNSEIVENSIRGYTWFGVEVESSGNSTLKRNILVENRYNFGVDGFSLSDFINDIDVSNTVNGKPVRYLINQHNITVGSSTFPQIGYLGLVNCSNVKVKDLTVEDNVQGILLASAINSTITRVNAQNNWNGIYVVHSSNTTVSDNEANSNYDYGIKFFNSSRSVARENNVDNNGWAGIGVFKSPNSTIEDNEANFNTYNLHVVYTNNSVIAGNNALIKPGASGDYSIAVYYSHHNLLYHNTFDNRLLYVETRNGKPFTPSNSWDSGGEGNYWSNYRGVDADFDGIGDVPYTVGKNNYDNHPLMGRFSEFIVTFGGKNHSVSSISNSTVSQFQFSPEDGEIGFVAAVEDEAMGFSRIAIPNSLLQELPSRSLTVLINGEQPVLEREWTDETNTYLYFSHGGDAAQQTIDPRFILVVAAVSLIVFMILILISKKKLRRSPADRELKP